MEQFKTYMYGWSLPMCKQQESFPLRDPLKKIMRFLIRAPINMQCSGSDYTIMSFGDARSSKQGNILFIALGTGHRHGHN